MRKLLSWIWDTNDQRLMLSALLFVANLYTCTATNECEQRLGGSVSSSGVIPFTPCNYLIVAPDNNSDYQVQLEFTHGAADVPNTIYGAFEIYDGNGTGDPLLLNVSQLSAAPSRWLASSTDRLYFRSLTGPATHGGLRITYSIAACLMKPKQKEMRSGEIRSPGYPASYAVPTCSSWSLQSRTQHSIITISFDDLDLPLRESHGSPACLSDFVRIGPDPDITFCGSRKHDLPRLYVSNRNHVWIKYRYSGSGQGQGFALSYISSEANELACGPEEFGCKVGGCVLRKWRCNNVIECPDGSDETACHNTVPPPSDPHTSEMSVSTVSTVSMGSAAGNGQEAGCDQIFRDSSGTLSSPNFPKAYPPNVRCVYTLVAPPGGHIQLTIHSLALGLHSYVTGNADALQVSDNADGGSSERLMARFVDVMAPEQVMASIGNVMYLLLTTDRHAQDAGFNASYSVVECVSDAPSYPRGRIQSPDYPGIATHHVCHNWTLQALADDGIITLSFSHIDLPSSNTSTCLDNYILLGPDPAVRLCGHVTRPLPYITNAGHVSILYNYRGDNAGSGFSLEYIISRGGDHARCLADEFACASGGGCVMDWWRCNGVNECADGSDERDCNRSSFRPPDELACNLGMSSCKAPGMAPGSQHHRCIFSAQWCDGTRDCDDGSDEDFNNCDKECSGSYEGPSGVLLSPRYPARYPELSQCRYFLHAAQGSTIQLRPTAFSLSAMDMLQVYDGADNNAALLEEFHAQNPFPRLVTSSSNRLYLLFVTGGGNSHRGYGFNITYQQKGRRAGGGCARSVEVERAM